MENMHQQDLVKVGKSNEWKIQLLFFSNLVRAMSQLYLLEDLYNQRIKIDEEEQKKYQGLLKYVVDTTGCPKKN